MQRKDIHLLQKQIHKQNFIAYIWIFDQNKLAILVLQHLKYLSYKQEGTYLSFAIVFSTTA